MPQATPRNAPSAPLSSAPSKQPLPLRRPTASSTLPKRQAGLSYAQSLLPQIEKRLRSLDAHSLCVLSSDAFFALGIADPIAWYGQSSWLADGLLKNLFITDDKGETRLWPTFAQSLGELACTRRYDVDSACQHLLTLAATHLFLHTACEDLK